MDKPSTVTPSVLQTIAQAVDCLDGLLKNTDGYSLGPAFQAKVLVVDDDTVCNHVNVTSLKRANFDAVGVKDPAAALSLLETTEYDLVVLDVNMPGMTGFDVCEKMRRLPHSKKTPVIFVTAFSNFDNRKQSVLSGGNDFVSKPVSPVELALKVSVNLIKARVQGTPGSPLEAQPAQPTVPPAHLHLPPGPKRIGKFPPRHHLRNLPRGWHHLPSQMPEMPERRQLHQRHSPNPATASGQHAWQRWNAKAWKFTNACARARQHWNTPRPIWNRNRRNETRIESQWREQLNAAKALIGQTENVLKEKEAQCNQLEEESAGLRKLRDELQGKLATEQQALAKSQQEIKAFQERQGQSTAELERAKTALKEKEARCHQLEEESVGLRKLRDEFQGKLATEQQALAKSQQEIKAFQERQGQSAAELERAKTALKEKEARGRQLEEESAGLRKLRDEFQGKLATEQQALAKSQQEIKAFQERQGQSAAELERAKTALEQQSAERTRLESEWREQLNAAKTTVSQTGTALKEKETRCGQLEKELVGLQQTRDELQAKFAAEQQAVTKSQQEMKELQGHLRQAGADLERAKASLEQESAKRARLESDHKAVADAKEALNLELRSLRERQAAREAELRDRQKKLVEGLRENLHHLQAKLQEIETFGSDLGEVSGGKT